ncbi:MAG: acyl carrier protein [Sulfurospirillum sp.]|nr:MAG: acyl carrier protein [Sulfurospirillum sp.]
MALIDEVKEVVAEQLNVNADEIKEESKFVEDLGADSLDVVELIMELEEKFDIEIPDSEAENIATVGDAIKYIETHNA